MKLGVCKLCHNKSELKKSHAIANSIFKKIFRSASGKAVLLSKGNDKIAYTSDSWAEEQLCDKCEGLLSAKYEKYSLELLRGRKGTVINYSTNDFYQNVKVKEVVLFFLSIYWRAAHSSHKSYGALKISLDNSLLIRDAIVKNSEVRLNKYAVRVYKLIDSTGSEEDFEKVVLKNFVVSPYIKTPSALPGRVTICFVFEGFYIEIIEKGLKYKERAGFGALDPKGSMLRIQHKCIFDIPELVEIMRVSLDKHNAGHTLI